jgi:hypothetical protein
MEKKHSCTDCGFRKKYDDNPRSLLGRIWRWHAGFCPGWKAYITSLPDSERISLATQYQLKKYL